MDGQEYFAVSFAQKGGSDEFGSSDWELVGGGNATAVRRPLPRPLQTAQGYFELATAPAARLGLSPRLRRRTLRRVLRMALAYTAGAADRASRELLIGQSLRLLGRYEAALPRLRRAARERSLRRDALLALAWCHKRRGRLDEAIAAVTRALATAPDDAVLHYNLACYLALSLQPQAALYELSWALELQPRLRWRAAVEADFELFRGSAAFEALTATARDASQRSSGP